MKKLFAILAVASLVVACGGGNAKDEPKSIEDLFLEHVAKMEKAVEANDWDEAFDAYMAYEEWVNSLDDESHSELFKAFENNSDIEVMDEVGSAYYAHMDYIIGDWVWCDENAHFDTCTLESNGEFYRTGYLCREASGTWHLSGRDIVLEYEDGETTICTVADNDTLIIDGVEYTYATWEWDW